MFTQKTDRLDFKTFQPLEEVTAMSASIVERTANSITVQIQILLSPSSLLDSEEWIQSALNEAGSLATGEAIQKFDTNGLMARSKYFAMFTNAAMVVKRTVLWRLTVELFSPQPPSLPSN
jgi:hypothetical protein